VHIWNVAQQSKMASFEHHEGAVTSLAFSENGYYLATASDNAMVKIWDLRKGDFVKPFHTIEFEAGYVPQSLAFDYSGAYLAVGGADVRLYGVKGWNQLSTLSDNTNAVTGLAFGADAKSLVTSSLDRSLKTYGL
jgi:pre-mRNA-processing factor 19